jgi:hypothetical protein
MFLLFSIHRSTPEHAHLHRSPWVHTIFEYNCTTCWDHIYLNWCVPVAPTGCQVRHIVYHQARNAFTENHMGLPVACPADIKNGGLTHGMVLDGLPVACPSDGPQLTALLHPPQAEDPPHLDPSSAPPHRALSCHGSGACLHPPVGRRTA